MENKNDNTKRLAKNTLLLYLRSLFNLFVALYSSRLVLQALGVEDYGINNAVAGFVSMFWLVTGSLSSAVSRFLTFELGRNDAERTDKVFSLSLNILLVMGLVVLLLSESFGIWFLRNRLNIPDGRDYAAFWVFQFSVLTVITSFIIVPFNAAIIAHERMNIYAFLGIGETLVKLFIALFLVYGSYSIDRLILYSLLWLIATLSMQGITFVYCRKSFPECRFRLLFDKPLFKQLFSFAGWNFVGKISGTFSGQGVNVVMNIIFGPVINSARGLAGTVGNTVAIFVNNFTTAIRPQVTKAYATGDLDYMKFLVFRGCKFSFFIMFFFALPLFLETAYALDLWLVEVPEHTMNFIRIALLSSLIDLHYLYFGMAQHATGDIRKFELVNSLLIFMIFPLSYILLKLGFAPEISYYIGVFISLSMMVWTLSLVHKTLGFSFREIISNVYSRTYLVVLTASPIPILVHCLMPYGFLRFICVGCVSVLCCALSMYWLGCNKGERDYILSAIKSYLARFHS